MHCSLYKTSSFALGRFCSRDDPWSFAASHSLMHFINRCTWKSSQYYIIISIMTSFMHMSQKLVFHQSQCICAIMPILSTTAMYVSSSSFMYFFTANAPPWSQYPSSDTLTMRDLDENMLP